jgi:RNA polymerase sigma-70 factor (ECF subfamily)
MLDVGRIETPSMAHRPPVEPATTEPQWPAALFEEYRPRLERFVVGILHDREAAADVVQTVFAKAVEAADKLRPEGAKSWLYKAAFHEAISWKRRAGVERKAADRLLERERDKGSRTEADLPVRNETVERVREAVRELSIRQQEVLRARIYDEKTYAEIAADLQAPLGTVLTQMRRALEKLRQRLNRTDG